MNILRRLSTLRHGRGFGVHSPLAYELIKTVLSDKPPYYGDRQVNELLKGKRERRIGRVVLRLVARFLPSEVYAEGEFARIVRIASPSAVLTDRADRADMVISYKRDKLEIMVGKEAAGSGPLILTNESDLSIIVYRRGLSPTLVNTTL